MNMKKGSHQSQSFIPCLKEPINLCQLKCNLFLDHVTINTILVFNDAFYYCYYINTIISKHRLILKLNRNFDPKNISAHLCISAITTKFS
jgi:hypothetical protein